jgi:hypothetical protein
MKLIQELLILRESAMSNLHIEAQELLMQKFGLGDQDAEGVMDFLTGGTDFTELSDEAREKLASHYEKDADASRASAARPDIGAYVKKALTKELALPVAEGKKPAKKPELKFTWQDHWSQWNGLAARVDSHEVSYEETEIDGKLVGYLLAGKNVIGMWYNSVRGGTTCPEFKGDAVEYAEADPRWPYGD